MGILPSPLNHCPSAWENITSNLYLNQRFWSDCGLIRVFPRFLCIAKRPRLLQVVNVDCSDCVLEQLCPANTQIRLCIRATWSVFTDQSVYWRFLHADIEDTVQTVQMCRLIWILAERTWQKVSFLTFTLTEEFGVTTAHVCRGVVSATEYVLTLSTETTYWLYFS